MYQGGVEFPRIKRFARWLSDTAHDYMWEAHESQRGLAKVMVGADYHLTDPGANARGPWAPPPHDSSYPRGCPLFGEVERGAEGGARHWCGQCPLAGPVG